MVSTVGRPILMLLCVSLAAAASEGSVTGHASAELQEDSNPTRSFIGQSSAVPGWTAALLGTGAVTARLAPGELSGAATYELGARHYLSALPYPMDTLTQQLAAQGTYRLSPVSSVSLSGTARDRVGFQPHSDGERPYTHLEGVASFGLRLGQGASAQGGLGAQRFILWDRDPVVFGYSFSSPLFRGQVAYAPNRHHGFGVGLSFEPRTYNAVAIRNGPTSLQGAETRRDSVFSAGVHYSYRGPVLLNGSYEFIEQDSNSYQQTNARHRLSAGIGMALPFRLSLLAQGTLQFSHYPEGLPASALLLTEESENTSSVSVELARPVLAQLDVQLRYGFYGASLHQNGFSYQRQLLSAGLAFRF